ncbi:MAG: helix-turn-helix transcriptional regulator [Cyanobacteria bacterium SIG31]|nr:helix-turn-helix transcriptional regulator [Cyanobacteria bacterium SIG31]
MGTEINKQLGKRIQYLRKQRGFSQEKFAEAIDIATTSLSYIETGRGFMSLTTLEKMTEVLDVELHEIFQFISIKTNDEMYDYLIKKITDIKDDNDKLKTVYSILKNIL